MSNPSAANGLVVLVECAFGADISTDPATWTWTDISRFVIGDVTISKGAHDEATAADPAACNLTLDNTEGQFTKGNPSSPYWPYVRQNTPLRVRVTWQGAPATYERFTGLITGWPIQPVAGVLQVLAPIEAAGRLRLLRRNHQATISALTRTLSGLPDAYWPLEDAAGAKSGQLGAVSGVVTAVRMVMKNGTVSFGSSDTPAGSASAADFSNGGQLTGTITNPFSVNWQVEWSMNIANNASTADFLWVNLTGADMVRFAVDNAQLTCWSSGSSVVTPFSTSPTANTWQRWKLGVKPSGADVVALLTIDDVTVASQTYTTRTNGIVNAVVLNPGGAASPHSMKACQVAVFSTTPFTTIDTVAANDAYVGETVDARLARIATEADIDLTVTAATTPLDVMGPQPVASLPDILDDCATVDMGLLHDGYTLGKLQYVDRSTRYNQAVQMTLDYLRGQIGADFAGTSDDQNLENRVQIDLTTGGSTRPYTHPSAATIGTVDGGGTKNLTSTSQALLYEQWLAWLGSYDGYRFPQVSIDILDRSPELAPKMVALTLPARISLVNLPLPYPPVGMDQFAEGYTETLSAVTWKVDFNTSPYEPWRVGAVADATNPWRVDSDSSTLSSAVTSTATSLTVGAVEPWTTTATYPSDFPFDVDLEGIRTTVTAITNAVTDTFTRTTSSSWGSADSGQAWTNTGGSASDFSVGSGAGKHSQTSVNVARNSLIAIPTADADLYASAATDALAAGASQYVTLVARYADANNMYLARLDFSTTQTVSLTLRVRLAGTETQLAGGTVAGLTHAANTFFRMRLRVVSNTLMAKVWLASGSEPSAWTFTATEPDLTAAGSVGVRSMLATGNTNTLPVGASFDDFAVVNPQTFTVVRSVNGVDKAHNAGTAVKLWRPAVIAL